MKKKVHDDLQESINKLQEHQHTMSMLIVDLCDFLGTIINYKHRKKSGHRILVTTINGEEYDTDDLKEQANEYIRALGKSGK